MHENFEKEIYERILKPLLEDHIYLYEIQSDMDHLFSVQLKKMMQLGLKLYFAKLDRAIKLLISNGLRIDKQVCPEVLSELQHNCEALSFGGIEIKAPYELLGLSYEDLKAVHGLFNHYLEREEIIDASCLALLLTALEPNQMASWIGLGLTEQLSGRFQEATLAFSNAMKVGKGSLLPLLYAAKGYVQLSQLDLARELLHKLLQVKSEAKENEAIKKQALALLPMVS